MCVCGGRKGMWECMQVYKSVCVCWVRVCVCEWVFACLWECVYMSVLSVCVWERVCVSVCVWVCVSVHMSECGFVCVNNLMPTNMEARAGCQVSLRLISLKQSVSLNQKFAVFAKLGVKQLLGSHLSRFFFPVLRFPHLQSKCCYSSAPLTVLVSVV